MYDFERIENDKVICGKREDIYVFYRTNQQMPLYYQFKDYINNKSNFSIPKVCRKISIPTLITHGDNDQTNLSSRRDMCKYFKFILLKIEYFHHTNAKHPFNEKFLPIQLKKVIAETISFFKTLKSISLWMH